MPGAAGRTEARDDGLIAIPGPAGDLIGRLPPEAAAKLRRLRATADDAAAAARSLNDLRSEAIQQKQALDARYRHLKTQRLFDPEAAVIVELVAQIDYFTAHIKELDGRLADVRSRTPRVLATVERFLRETRGPLAAHQRKVKVPPGATVEGQRAALRELAADLHEVRSAPVPSSAVKARIREQVDALAERGCPNVHHILEGSDAGILWNMLTLRANINGHAATEGMPAVVGIAQTSTPDAFALLAWLAKDALIARLEAEVDEQSDDAAALGDDERAEKEDALLQRMLECERIEELLCEAEGAERRPDGDARAVLGIAE